MKLYKYVGPERIQILEQQTIRFSQPYSLNDPFESFPFYTDQGANSFMETKWNPETKELENKPGKDLLTWFINNNLVSLSLSEKKDNLLMWAHYAANHSGFVIELNSDHPFFTDKSRQLYKVTYQHQRPAISLADCEKLILGITGDLKNGDAPDKNELARFKDLFCKSSDWGYEQEWRLLATPGHSLNFKEDNHGFTISLGGGRPMKEHFIVDYISLFHLPADCITGIFCGAKMNGDLARRLYFLIKNNPVYQHIDLRLASLDKESFSLNFNTLTDFEILKAGEWLYEQDIINGKQKRLYPKWYHFSYKSSYERKRRAAVIKDLK